MSGAGIGAVFGFLLGGPVGALAGAALGAASDKKDKKDNKTEEKQLRVEEISKRVEQAIQHEEVSGALSARLRGHLAEKGAADTEGLVAFVRDYVRLTPALIEAMRASAKAASEKHPQVESRVAAVLLTAQEYFFEEHDFIPDSVGLLGLLDDAYLALSLIGRVSNEIAPEGGRSLFPPDMEVRNKLVEGMLGPKPVSAIREKVEQTMQMPSSRAVLEDLVNMAGPLLLAFATQRRSSSLLSRPGPTTSAVNHMAAMNGFDYQVG